MLLTAIPKLPMRDPASTRKFYHQLLGFDILGDYGDYLLLKKDEAEIHFFISAKLNPLENEGQVYIRINGIDNLYATYIEHQVPIHPNGALADKPWGQREFSLLDPDHNLLTFGEEIKRS